MQMVAPDVFAHAPPLLCGVLALRADREKRRFLETGQNTAFGAFPVYVGATMISGFVATALTITGTLGDQCSQRSPGGLKKRYLGFGGWVFAFLCEAVQTETGMSRFDRLQSWSHNIFGQ